MVLNKIRNSLKTNREYPDFDKEEYVEVDLGGGTATAASSVSPPVNGKIGIRIESLTDFGETEKILRFLREGEIVMLKIKTLKEKDLSELKRAVDKLKRTILAQNGDLVGVEQDWLLLVPEHTTVFR